MSDVDFFDFIRTPKNSIKRYQSGHSSFKTSCGKHLTILRQIDSFRCVALLDGTRKISGTIAWSASRYPSSCSYHVYPRCKDEKIDIVADSYCMEIPHVRWMNKHCVVTLHLNLEETKSYPGSSVKIEIVDGASPRIVDDCLEFSSVDYSNIEVNRSLCKHDFQNIRVKFSNIEHAEEVFTFLQANSSKIFTAKTIIMQNYYEKVEEARKISRQAEDLFRKLQDDLQAIAKK